MNPDQFSLDQIIDMVGLIGWPGFILFLFYKDIFTWGKDTRFWKDRALRQMDKNEQLADGVIKVAERRQQEEDVPFKRRRSDNDD